MTSRLALGLLVILVAAGPVLAADQPVEVGRVYYVDGSEGYLIARFPSGQRIVDIGKRDIWQYQVGDEIRLDALGRPLPPT